MTTTDLARDGSRIPNHTAAVDFNPIEAPAGRTESRTELLEAGRLVRSVEARHVFKVLGRNLTAAVIDTGIRADHVYFRDRVVVQLDFTCSPVAEVAPDTVGHGTHVAGIIAADGNHIGMAPRARLAALRVFRGPKGGFSEICAALSWVLAHHQEHGISVVCMSLSDGRNSINDTLEPNDAIRRVISNLRARRIPVVVAAGNHYGKYQKPGMAYPAILRECISVGSVYDEDVGAQGPYAHGARAEQTGTDHITPFSQRLHPSHGGTSSTTIFAPGAPITSAGHESRTAVITDSGTSQAAPVVTGAILLLQEYVKSRTGHLPEVAQIEGWLRSGAARINDGDDERNNIKATDQEYLRIDVCGALVAARQSLQDWAASGFIELRGPL